MSGGGARVSIPASVRRTIQNIKEIAGHHSDEDVYAMLKECAMDPNETAQKLLLQDTFHEVKRKRDKRKENVRENPDLRWRQGAQGRGGRGGRVNYPLSHLSNGGVEGKKNLSRNENGVQQGPDKVNKCSPAVATSIENKITTSISSKTDIPSSTQQSLSQTSVDGGKTSREEVSIAETRIRAEAAEHVLVPSLDAHSPGDMGDTNGTIQSQGTPVKVEANKSASPHISRSEFSSLSTEGSTEMSSSNVHGEIQVKPQGSEVNQLQSASQVPSLSSFGGHTGSRPSSNYNDQPQQLAGSQKAVPNREWKLKSANANPVQASGSTDDSDGEMLVGAVSLSLPSTHSDLSETSSNLEKKLDELQLSVRQHVIIPNHLQVPDSERHGLSFGSFDASFNFKMGFTNGHMSDTSATLSSGLSCDVEEIVEQPTSSLDGAPSAAQETDFSEVPEQPKSPTQVPEIYSSREAATSGLPSMKEHDLAKEEPVVAPEDPKYQTNQPLPVNSTFGFSPQVFGSQFSPFGSSEPQAHNTTHVPNIVVQQPFDMSASYYTQLYRPTADADGHMSPFLAPGGSTKYNGNVAVVPTQTSHGQQESGNSAVLSNSGSTQPATQAVCSMQSSIAVSQQPVPVYRQPAAVHLSHYPMPYSQYFPMFYVPPTLHPFLSSAGFPQQPPIGSMYPQPGAAAAAAATPVKFPVPQYKQGTDIGNSALIGTAAGYGTYNSMPAGYTPNPHLSSGNSTGSEDPSSAQFKENNFYSSEQQQSESSAVWIPAAAHGRDISSLQASSFYSIPPQGQHMTFAPTPTVHSAFNGIYHPTPAVAASAVHPLVQQSQSVAGAAEMTAPPAVYQQAQHAQINWTNNY
ncbi:GBF-interacting protein 1-like isoform X5 [Canna indica]|uniref:GBF-interacting protein 1-like isoform X5 n=1 Tax=Canna indica TaxID=4628 RepID=A0AAQ3JMW4_9LILI|nr:GBF-interacting protein 1-like isoform X5 [Canna indica]